MNLDGATQHLPVFEGGDAGAPVIAQVDGKPLTVEDIGQQHGLTWTMRCSARHGHAMMHEPLFCMRRGEPVVLKMIDNTLFEHPTHLHGHCFRVLAHNDRPNPLRAWRNTVMRDPMGSCDVAFAAEKPGEWMCHCRVLDHAAGGMAGAAMVFD